MMIKNVAKCTNNFCTKISLSPANLERATFKIQSRPHWAGEI